MKTRYRIVNQEGHYWSSTSVVPAWTDHGIFFTEEQLKNLLTQFKYQRALWPADAKVVECEVSEDKPTQTHIEILAEIDEELTFEKLKGSSY